MLAIRNLAFIHIKFVVLSVLVFYAAKTNYHKFSDLKQHIYYLAVSVGSGHKGSLLQFHHAAFEVLARTEFLFVG